MARSARRLPRAIALVLVSRCCCSWGNLRAALVVALILPLSALATFVPHAPVGLSANLMSLGGLAIAIGMLVDAAVVVVKTSKRVPQSRVRRACIALYRATQVAHPVGAGVAIIMIVFLPLLTLQAWKAKLFGPVALTIVFALGASLLLSLTVIPVLASWLLRPHAPGHHASPWLVRKLEAGYAPLLDAALRHPRVVGAGAVLALAGPWRCSRSSASRSCRRWTRATSSCR